MDNQYGNRDNFTSDEFRGKYYIHHGIRNYGDVVSGYGKKGGGKCSGSKYR